MSEFWDRYSERQFLYVDVEELLSQGALYDKVSIEDVRLTLRSLTFDDMRMIRLRCHDERDVGAWAVAQTTYMVNGRLVQTEDERWDIFEALQQAPHPLTRIAFITFSHLQDRLQECARRLESFCYERPSRALWKTMGRRPPVETALGRMWTTFNTMEDEREGWDRDWYFACFQASVHNPKGVGRLFAQDKLRKEDILADREDVVRKCLADVTGDKTYLVAGRAFYKARTAEDLDAQMKRALAGEKDFHDLVIEQYKQSLYEKAEQARQQHEERIQNIRRMDDDAETSVMTRVSPEDLREFIDRRSSESRMAPDILDTSRFDVYLQPTDVGEAALFSQPVEGAQREDLMTQVSRRKPTL